MPNDAIPVLGTGRFHCPGPLFRYVCFVSVLEMFIFSRRSEANPAVAFDHSFGLASIGAGEDAVRGRRNTLMTMAIACGY
jgi:hypothetical protein